MAGARISQLPAVSSVQGTDVLPEVQNGVTYKSTINQVATYLGFSSGILATSSGGTGVNSVTTSPTASSFAGWDSNKNLSANSFIDGYTTTVTANSTTTLTVASTIKQFFTGGNNQTVVLPVTSTLVVGQAFEIFNNTTGTSTGYVTVQSSGLNTIAVMNPGTRLLVVCISTSGTGSSSWYSFLESASSQFQWNINVTTNQTIVPNNGYQANNAGATVVFTLPISSLLGVPSQVCGGGSASSSPWKIAQPVGVTIQVGNTFTTTGTGGYLQATSQSDWVEMMCVGGGNLYLANVRSGNITVV